MNNRELRQQKIRNVAKQIDGVDVPSFEQGAKFADYHPNWIEGKPEMCFDEYGMPKLYLCKILACDMTFGYKYTYRVGFVTKEDKWNCENVINKVVAYLEIFANQSKDQLLKDIEKYGVNF